MYNNIVNPLNGKTLNIQDITGQKLLGRYIYQYNSELVKSVLVNMHGGASKISKLDISGTLNDIKGENPGKIINIELLKKLYGEIDTYIKSLNKSDRVVYEKWVHKKLRENPDIGFGTNDNNEFDDYEIEDKRVALVNFLIGKNPEHEGKVEEGEVIPTHNIETIPPDAKDCFGEYKITIPLKTLGKGVAGTVYEVEKKGTKFAMKEQHISTSNSREKTIALNKIGTEIKIGTLMGENNLGPKIYKSYLCESGDHTKVLIVMEIMNKGSLEEFSQKNLLDSEFIQTLRDKVKKMHELKIFHMDLHAGNIFVHQKSGPGDVSEPYIGDFGTSDFFDGQMAFSTRHEAALYFLDNLFPDPTKLIVRTMMAIEVL